MRERLAFQDLMDPFGGTALPEWPHAVAALTVRRIARGATVFRQGDVHPYVYVVRRGLVKLAYLDDRGAEWIKSFSREGHFFASIAALRRGGETSFTTEALEPSVLERIDYRVLDALARTHLAWARAIGALTMAFAARKEQRERELLTLRPEDRYLAFLAAHPDLVERIPQKDLARHFGITPVGLNRIVARVRRRGAGQRGTDARRLRER